MVPMRERRGERLKSSMLVVEERGRSERKKFKIDEEPDGSDCGEEAFDGSSKGEKTAINEGGDILCEEDVVLEESEEEVKSKGMASQLIKEREIEVLNVEKSMRRNEDVVLGRKREGDKLRDTEEVGQQGVEDKGTKKRDKERSKIRDRQETSEMLGSLTKKRGQRCPQHIEMSL